MSRNTSSATPFSQPKSSTPRSSSQFPFRSRAHPEQGVVPLSEISTQWHLQQPRNAKHKTSHPPLRLPSFSGLLDSSLTFALWCLTPNFMSILSYWSPTPRSFFRKFPDSPNKATAVADAVDPSIVTPESITPTMFKYEWTTKFDETVNDGDSDFEKAVSWYLVARVSNVSFAPTKEAILALHSHSQISPLFWIALHYEAVVKRSRPRSKGI